MNRSILVNEKDDGQEFPTKRRLFKYELANRGYVTLQTWVPPMLTLGVVLIVTEVVLLQMAVPTAVVPRPSLIFRALVNNLPQIWTHLRVTIAEALIGFAGGTITAVFTAIVFTIYKPAQRGLLPIVIALQTVPVIVLAPILALTLGNGMISKSVVAGLITFFPTVINMVRGLSSPSPLLFDLFTTLDATRLQVLFKLRLPASMSYLFASLKIATANCFIGALVAEWISADRGAGYLMVIKMYQLETPMLYATVFATSMAAIFFFRLVGSIEAWFLPWAVRREVE
ncbi:MAG: ABC transporter permease [Pyrinomonadaceae bacterium]